MALEEKGPFFSVAFEHFLLPLIEANGGKIWVSGFSLQFLMPSESVLVLAGWLTSPPGATPTYKAV